MTRVRRPKSRTKAPRPTARKPERRLYRPLVVPTRAQERAAGITLKRATEIARSVQLAPKKESYERVVTLPDLHSPYQHAEAFEAALAFVRTVRPHLVVVLGDWIDFYQLSGFIKDPGRSLELQADLDVTHQALRDLRRAAPGARAVYLRGNHEYRLTKYLWGSQSPLASLRGLRVPELLGLASLSISYHESGQTRLGALTFKHGNIVRPKAGYSATAELERLWVSGVSAHTHRLAQVYKTNEAGMFTWIESGCLCRLDPEYAEGQTVDWQHGLTYAEVATGGRHRFRAEAVPIINGKITFGGKDIA